MQRGPPRGSFQPGCRGPRRPIRILPLPRRPVLLNRIIRQPAFSAPRPDSVVPPGGIMPLGVRSRPPVRPSRPSRVFQRRNRGPGDVAPFRPRCHRGARLRLPVCAADRPPHPGGRRLRRAVPVGRGPRRGPRPAAEGLRPLGRSGQRLRARRPLASPLRPGERPAGAGDLLRDATVGPRPGRAGGSGPSPGIRSGGGGDPGAGGSPLARAALPHGRLDVPRGPGGGAPSRLPGHGPLPQRPLRVHRRSGPPPLRRAVPPRGRPHAPGPGAAAPLRGGAVRLSAHLGPPGRSPRSRSRGSGSGWAGNACSARSPGAWTPR